MKLIAPDYYPHFACIADKCRHSCCVGWEIDVDEDALARFRQVEGLLGQRLRESIVLEGDAPHFRLDAQERCPFLNERGLCDLIIGLAEDCLCQICADHPRYRHFWADRTEIGLGLCCEAAGRLILSRQEPARLTTLEDDGQDDELPQEEALLLQQRDALIALAQDRSMTISQRAEHLANMSGLRVPEASLPRWAELLLTLELLDEAWGDQLTLLRDAPAPDDMKAAPWAIHLEQLLVYFLYRHIPGAMEDDDLPGRLAFCVLAWRIVRRLFLLQGEQTLDTLVEVSRLFSSEIEYSDDNLTALLDALYEEDGGNA